MLIHNNTSSNENIEIISKASYSLLYLHNRNNNSVVRKDTNTKINKTITVSHEKNDSLVSMANIIVAKSNNSYDN